MTKEEFDSIEEGDEIYFGSLAGWHEVKKSSQFEWLSLDGTRFVDSLNYRCVDPPRNKAPTQPLSGSPFKVGDTVVHKLDGDFGKVDSVSKDSVIILYNGSYLGYSYQTADTYWRLNKATPAPKNSPKISDYPHRCDCGSPAFANFLTVDCKAKCSNPNVRNV